MDPIYHPSQIQEKTRYLEHNNRLDDLGYQNFLKPLIDYVCLHTGQNEIGLDFGCGTVPIASHLLQKKGYQMWSYDPYFFPETKALEQRYDFLVASEVIEHFRKPRDEFFRMKSLLKEKAQLFFMTSLFEEGMDFQKWYYKDDQTHLFFYEKRAFDWICDYFQFSSVEVNGKLIRFVLDP
ncbi:putative methyltransferase [Leptospira ryugenii]|uniref:Putative methyltransferase n=2 Tax=Leptospira ryugenii TaxID=1917863 RepID=A0A2P2DXL6_9LEPT|nr:putative methyltransferase [Leptospira ryugenii]